MIHTYCPLPRTEMDPAMLIIILKVVRLRNHQILAKDPRVNQAFQDLFAGKEVTTRTGLVTKATFNNVLTEALEKNKILGIEIYAYGPHVIAVWGVRYGSDGFIDRLYITDSAVANENDGTSSCSGLQYTPVTYGTDGTPYIAYNQGYAQASVRTLYTFSSCEEIWRGSPYALSK